MNATTLAGFVHCMNFISTADVKDGATTNYLLAFKETMAAATAGNEPSVCEGMQELGLAWLSSAQLDNWSMMCQNKVMRDRLMDKWVADEVDDVNFANMTPSQFDTQYQEYWGNAVDASNSAYFASIGENLYGNEMACGNLNSDLNASPNTVAATCSTPLDWENMNKVQTTLLSDVTTDLLDNSTADTDLCYNSSGTLSAYSDNAYNCCVNSQNSTEFSSCVRTAFGVGEENNGNTAFSGNASDAKGYDNVLTLGLGNVATAALFTNATAEMKVGSYGFEDVSRFHELNCLFTNGDAFFQEHRVKLFNTNALESSYRSMLNQLPTGFKRTYSQEDCQALFKDNAVLSPADCTKVSQYEVVFGKGTFRLDNGVHAGCPANVDDPNATPPVVAQAVNRLHHCCSAEYAAHECPMWANDSMWTLDATTNESPNGKDFAEKTKAQVTASWDDVDNHASRYTSADMDAVLGVWFSQLPIGANVGSSLVFSYEESFKADTDTGVAFQTAANGETDAGTALHGCNKSDTATASVESWVDCMICTAGGNTVTDTNLYAPPAGGYSNIAGCQGTAGDVEPPSESTSESPAEPCEGDDCEEEEDPSCPDNCKSSVLKTLGMSVIFAFIVNMMN